MRKQDKELLVSNPDEYHRRREEYNRRSREYRRRKRLNTPPKERRSSAPLGKATRDRLQSELIMLKEQGLGCKEIANRLNVSHSTVWSWLNPDRSKIANARKCEKRRERVRNVGGSTYYRWKYDLSARCMRALSSINADAKKSGYTGCYTPLEEVVLSYTGSCFICGKPEPTKGQRLCVDHCHKTGRFRGWLCHRCNYGVGFMESTGDATTMMIATLAYLGIT